MTKQEAKELSLEEWRYLAEHSEIRRKADLPKRIWNRLKNLAFECPLCEVFSCLECPLAGCVESEASFMRWLRAKDNMVREGAAREIVRLIEAWDARRRRRQNAVRDAT